jgi:Mrp family chromosome partitioning ATPase
LYFGQDNRIGLRDFLEEDIDLSKVIRTSALPGLDIISSGQAVRDPSGLLHTDKFITMLEELRNRYDYVLVDTAPVGIVTDGIPALRASDVNIFVLRWRHSPRETAEMPYALAASYDLKMIGVVVNDFRDDALYSSLEDSSGTYSSLYFGDLYTSGSGKMSMRHRLFGSKTNR